MENDPTCQESLNVELEVISSGFQLCIQIWKWQTAKFWVFFVFLEVFVV